MVDVVYDADPIKASATSSTNEVSQLIEALGEAGVL